MYTDPIADMLTRIRNAQAVKKLEVILPYSKLKFNIAKILETEKWIKDVEKIEPQISKKIVAKSAQEKNAKFNQLKIKLFYNGNNPKISKIKRISKPGRRIYVSKDNLPVVLNNYGIAIISTSKGLMTNVKAKKENLGGEVVCEIY